MRPDNFVIQELVTPDIFRARGDLAWQLLDQRALVALQSLRRKFGPITVNNWHSGGSYEYSGLRPFDCSVGAHYSQHKYGRAFDCKFHDVEVEEARLYVLDNDYLFPTINAIEIGVSWFHFDVRNLDYAHRIFTFKP